jgi:hypothetical protein
MPNLPEGLVVHCDKCNLVIPSDAPRPDESDCGFVALHKLAYFNPSETVAAQHLMAVAAWSLIYHKSLLGHPESAEYHSKFQQDRKGHFAESAVRKALTPEQVQAGLEHRRDSEFYK